MAKPWSVSLFVRMVGSTGGREVTGDLSGGEIKFLSTIDASLMDLMRIKRYLMMLIRQGLDVHKGSRAISS